MFQTNVALFVDNSINFFYEHIELVYIVFHESCCQKDATFLNGLLVN